MKTKKPILSVLMPVYNGEKYIGKALSSILCQTFTDFEMIVVNDASTDDTLKLINNFKDDRIKLVSNDKRRGLSESRETGIKKSNGEYVVFLDSDDYSDIHRLQIQFDFLQKNPSVGFCGTWVAVVNERGESTKQVWKHATSNERLSSLLFFRNCFSQSSIMIRKEILPPDAFDKEYKVAPDFNLWNRLSPRYKCANIPQILTYYRIHGSNMSGEMSQLVEEEGKRIFRKKLSHLGINPTDAELTLHDSLERYPGKFSEKKLNDAYMWFRKLIAANHKREYLPSVNFESVIQDYWFKICLCSMSYSEGEGMKQIKKTPAPSLSLRKKTAFEILSLIKRDSNVDISSYQWERYVS